MGWHMLVADDLARGTLVRIGTQSIAAHAKFNLLVPPRPKLPAAVALVRDWLAEQLVSSGEVVTP